MNLGGIKCKKNLYMMIQDLTNLIESWYRMCNDERSVYRKHGFDEPVLEWEEAVSMFRKMYGFKDVQKRLAGIF